MLPLKSNVIALRKEVARKACGRVMATNAVEVPLVGVVKTKTWPLPASATTNLGVASRANANPSRFDCAVTAPVIGSVVTHVSHGANCEIMKRSAPLVLTAKIEFASPTRVVGPTAIPSTRSGRAAMVVGASRVNALAGIAARAPIVSPSATEATLTSLIAYSCTVLRAPDDQT